MYIYGYINSKCTQQYSSAAHGCALTPFTTRSTGGVKAEAEMTLRVKVRIMV